MFEGFLQRLPAATLAAVAGLAVVGGVALAWPGYVEGRPASFEAGGTDGYYVWHDDNGMHLRTTDSSGVFRYTGALRTDGVFTDVNLVRAESDDHVEITGAGHVIRFQLKTAEGIDGFDFQVSGGKRVTFRLKRDGTLIDPANVFLGQDSVHPEHNPFRIRRDAHRTRKPATPAATATPTG